MTTTVTRLAPARRSASVLQQIAYGGAIAALVAVMVSMFWPWTTRGTGSAVPGHRLASLILEGRTDFVVPRVFGAVLYLVPVCAAASMALLTLRGRTARVVRIGTVVLAGGISITLLVLLHRFTLSGMGTGGWLACVGSAAALACLAVVWMEESR